MNPSTLGVLILLTLVAIVEIKSYSRKTKYKNHYEKHLKAARQKA